MALTQIQEEIIRALREMGEKSRFTEAILAKKIRELNKMDSKKKAGIALQDLEAAIFSLEEEGDRPYALTVNSSNELLIERRDEAKQLTAEARQRRLRSEKSMTVLKSTDLEQRQGKKDAKSANPRQMRTRRENLNIYGDWEE
ncbi:MAG: hypothetical protein IKP51_07840 [Treponema sp.]|nr:hypothetical protein [Treponema sp.]